MDHIWLLIRISIRGCDSRMMEDIEASFEDGRAVVIARTTAYNQSGVKRASSSGSSEDDRVNG